MKPLYILPFDHRSSFAKALLGFTYPVSNKTEARRMVSLKCMIFEAAKRARQELGLDEEVGILVEEEFGGDILREAKKLRMTRAVTVEKSGRPLFEFEYGATFGKHLKQYDPTFAKVLIHYDHADKKTNAVQNARLKKISDFCRQHKMGFMLEVLLEGKGPRFEQMKRMIRALETNGIKPDVWKLEGLEKTSQWKAIKKLTKADLIILGRGKSKHDVETWVRTAAASGVVRGFAIGRTVFFQPLKAYVAKRITRAEAIDRIKDNYMHFVRLFESSRPS